jgi:hypothetical protein
MRTSTRTISVTVTIAAMWALAVLQACVPRGVDFSQSQKPVAAVGSDTTAPATIT